jgi:hypothetical protein
MPHNKKNIRRTPFTKKKITEGSSMNIAGNKRERAVDNTILKGILYRFIADGVLSHISPPSRVGVY